MNDPLRVPKIQIIANVVLAGRPTAQLKLFLAEKADGHAGCERPSEMLNGSRVFLPVVDRGGSLLFLHREAIVSVSLPAELELGAPGEGRAPAPSTVEALVNVVMVDGRVLSGTFRFEPREGNRRTQDHLNSPDHFVAIQDGALMRFVNKRHIAQVELERDGVRQVSPSPEARSASCAFEGACG
ncbi:MAG TPA: hypothetical protein VJV23_10000 [Candidatus Polarisedimenticolia bacterium]|nr:hypothetical protein [Candidatus Polarisedimenticolia bacterium]